MDLETYIQKIARQFEIDQKARLEEEIDWEKTHQIDKESCELLKSFISKFGYPSVKKFGFKVSHNAWLLAQHSTHDIPFQEYYLSLMNQENEDESKIDRAYLTDRVAMMKNEPQIYGTQSVFNKETNKWETYNLLDPLSDIVIHE